MDKKLWWFTKKDSETIDETFGDGDGDYYGPDAAADEADGVGNIYSDLDSGDVSVVLSNDPSKKEPLMKRTFTPLTCDDSAEIVDAFKDGRVVVICVEELDKPNFLRLFDYLMGAVQALDGDFERIDRDTVMLLPYGVEKDIDLDELEEDIPEDDGDGDEDEDDEDID